MADYPARLDELKSALNELQNKDLAIVGIDAATVRTRYDVVRNGFDAYSDKRDRCLNDALSLLQQISDSMTGPDQQSRWVDFLNRAASDAGSAIAALFTDLEKSAPNLRTYLDTVAQQEAQFYSQFSRIPLAYFQGSVIQHRLEFDHEAAMLSEKWRALSDGGKSADERAKETLARVRELFKSVVEELVTKDRGLDEKVKNYKNNPEAVVTSGNNTEILKVALKEAVQALLRELEKYKETTQTYVQELSQAFAAQDVIVVMFTEIREAVRQFLQTTNLSTAVTEFNEAKSNAQSMAEGCPTDKQREDAKRFLEKAIDAVEPLMDAFKNAYEKFVGDNRGLFVGPVDLSRIDQLLELSANETSWHSIEDLNIEQTLKDLLDHAVNWGVSLDGLTGEQAQALRDAFKIELEPLSKGIVAAQDDHLLDQLRKMVTDKIGGIRNRLSSSKGGEG